MASDLAFTPVERAAMALCGYVNRNPRAKALQTAYHKHVAQRWMRFVLEPRLHVFGIEHVASLAPDRGVVLCVNHRSFFDGYVVMTILYDQAPWAERPYFPVRSNFFYERWSGLAVNGLIGGFVMWPPVFRDAHRATANKLAVDEICELVRAPGAVVGMHPEGTRGKGPDPYSLLPAQPGVGQIIVKARPIVLPVFVNGLSNRLDREVAARFGGASGAGQINVVFGPPVEFGALVEGTPRPALYKRVADRALLAIAALAEVERAERARQ
jgi:1-acyl-sn-glycerol-3-phosphate acyltransferase